MLNTITSFSTTETIILLLNFDLSNEIVIISPGLIASVFFTNISSGTDRCSWRDWLQPPPVSIPHDQPWQQRYRS